MPEPRSEKLKEVLDDLLVTLQKEKTRAGLVARVHHKMPFPAPREPSQNE